MSRSEPTTHFDSHLLPRERHFAIPRIALRQRSADHPMVMFFVIVMTTFVAAAMVSPSGTALASFGGQPSAGAAAKGPRLSMSETDIACSGQAWSVESEACLTAIARESGMEESRKVRLIAAAPQAGTPNIF